MNPSGLLLAIALAAPPRHAGPTAPGDSVAVVVDSARHEITISAGPFRLPVGAGADHHGMASAAGAGRDAPLGQLDWPVDGWFRGFRIRVTDGAGQPLPRKTLHHLIVVNFGRRQLVYAAPERLLGAGAETDDAAVPETVGIPMSAGMRLGMYAGWHNDTGRDLPEVYVHLTLLWTPTNQMPRPVSALPIYMDANLTVGGSNTFDVPPGRSSKAYDFTLPVGGRLLAVGGHVHDFGVRVQLDDATTGRTLATVAAERDSAGTVTGVGRQLFATRGNGLKLRRERRYRVVGVYDNPTDTTLPRAAMAHMVGLFAPDDLAAWPAIDASDADYKRDLEALQVQLSPDGRIVPARRSGAEHGGH